MNRILKIAAGSFLLAIIALPLLLSVGYVFQQKLTEYRMHQKLENASLQTIPIAKKDIHWIKEGHELLIGNELFDVKTYTVDSDQIIVKGLFDKVEDQLNNRFNQISKSNNDHPKALQLLAFNISINCIINEVICYNYMQFSANEIAWYSYQSSKKADPITAISTPPPEV